MKNFIDYLTRDHINGISSIEKKIINPSLQEILMYIDLLDADQHTIIFLHAIDKTSLTIGGGNNQYIAYYNDLQEDFWNLLSMSNEPSNTILLNIGGQEGDYLSKYIATKEQVFEAVNCYFTKHTLSDKLTWEKQKN